jgi:hypothetical protein
MAVPVLALTGLGAQVSGSILSGFFGYYNKKNEAAVAKYNAAVMFQRAKAIKQRTKFQQVRQAEEASRVQGELEAAIGGSGIVSTEGAPLLSLALQRSESDLQNYLIGYQGRTEAKEAESQAINFLLQAKQAKIAARQSLTGGLLLAGASALEGYGKIDWGQDIAKTAGSVGKMALGLGGRLGSLVGRGVSGIKSLSGVWAGTNTRSGINTPTPHGTYYA